MADRQHRDFGAALDDSRKAAPFARVRHAHLAKPPEPDGDGAVAQPFDRHLCKLGFPVAPNPPAYEVGFARFRMSLL